MNDKSTDLYNIFIEYGYIPLEVDINNVKQKVKCLDNEGYIVYPVTEKLQKGTKPCRFIRSNPDTINNIKHYIKMNNINVNLISDEYIDSHSHLIFECACGNLFNASWSNFSFNHKYQCNECSMGRPTHIQINIY